MNIAALARNVRIYLRSEAIAAEARLNFLVRKTGLLALAGAFAIFGLVLLNVGLYAFLLPIWGTVWTPAGLGLINLGLALLALVLAALAKPGPEVELAAELRSSAAAAIEDELKSGSGLGALASYVQGGQMAPLLIPAMTAIIGALRRRKAAK